MFRKNRFPQYVLVNGVNAAVDIAHTPEAARIKGREGSLLVKLWSDHKGDKSRVLKMIGA